MSWKCHATAFIKSATTRSQSLTRTTALKDESNKVAQWQAINVQLANRSRVGLLICFWKRPEISMTFEPGSLQKGSTQWGSLDCNWRCAWCICLWKLEAYWILAFCILNLIVFYRKYKESLCLLTWIYSYSWAAFGWLGGLLIDCFLKTFWRIGSLWRNVRWILNTFPC